jgi:glycerol-3-phosphate O-acyltransferase/dihydroxyacetone phosphate acyltransferase
MLVYRIVVLIWRIVAKIFFKDVIVVGKRYIPPKGALILCGNHSNMFVDPMLLLCHCPRAVSFLIAHGSMNKPVVGTFARKLN